MRAASLNDTTAGLISLIRHCRTDYASIVGWRGMDWRGPISLHWRAVPATGRRQGIWPRGRALVTEVTCARSLMILGDSIM
jgi:hypothetical protein